MRWLGRIGSCLAFAGLLVAGEQALAQQNGNGTGYNWSGFYGGGNLGGAFGGSDFVSGLGRGVPFFEGEFYPGGDNSAVAGIISAYRFNDVDVRSFSGGLQAGYNFWLGSFLVGIEADINFLDANKSKTTSAFGSPALTPALGPALYTFRNEIDANYVATLRPRIGIPVGGALIYATGGLALTTLKYEHNFRGSGGGFSPPGGSTIFEDASESETKVGWALGAGFELPIGPNVSIKTEYLFTAFGDLSSNNNKIQNLTDPPLAPVDFPCGHPDTGLGIGGAGIYPVPNPTPRQCFDHKANLFLHSIRLGVNFKF
jgi:outer membrane immunogenic protein